MHPQSAPCEILIHYGPFPDVESRHRSPQLHWLVMLTGNVLVPVFIFLRPEVDELVMDCFRSRRSILDTVGPSVLSLETTTIPTNRTTFGVEPQRKSNVLGMTQTASTLSELEPNTVCLI